MGNNISKLTEGFDPRYQNGKIYTITCEDGAIYVGSTIQSLNYRFLGHKKIKKCSMYKYIHNNYDGNWKKCKIELYENFPCDNKSKLEKREGEIIRLIGTINKVIAGRIDVEYQKEYQKIYRQKNTDILSEKKKIYYEKNADILLEKQKIYYEKNVDKIKKKVKIYYEENKEKLNQRTKKYYKENADIILGRLKQIIQCECGCMIGKYSLHHHKKTQIHQELINKQISEILAFLECF